MELDMDLPMNFPVSIKKRNSRVNEQIIITKRYLVHHNLLFGVLSYKVGFIYFFNNPSCGSFPASPSIPAPTPWRRRRVLGLSVLSYQT